MQDQQDSGRGHSDQASDASHHHKCPLPSPQSSEPDHTSPQVSQADQSIITCDDDDLLPDQPACGLYAAKKTKRRVWIVSKTRAGCNFVSLLLGITLVIIWVLSKLVLPAVYGHRY